MALDDSTGMEEEANIGKAYNSDSSEEDEEAESSTESNNDADDSEESNEEDDKVAKAFDMAEVERNLRNVPDTSSDDEDDHDEYEVKKVQKVRKHVDKEEDEDEESGKGGSGWADAMAKVLNTGKRSDPKKPLLLSKAKKDCEISGLKKSTTTTTETKSLSKLRQKKKEIDEMGKVKPDIVKDRAREKKLAKVATRGVVQLFNAVREQQKTLKTQLAAAGQSVVKRDKVFKNIDKDGFLEVLSGNKKKRTTTNVEENRASKKHKSEVKEEEDEGTWSVLRDDFMLGAKMRDWDKGSDSGGD